MNGLSPSITLTTPLGEDKLKLRSLVMVDRLSQPFEMRLVLLSSDYNLDFDQLLGESLTVRMTLRSGRYRYFNGLVAQVSFAGSSGRQAVYNVVLRPWLWFLTRTGNCRIFQQESVPDLVLEKVFKDHGFTDFERKLSSSYAPREYCVQYRESDFNFVSRLLEEEGIYYYFKHEEDKHKLVLCDAVSAHEQVQDYEEVRYVPEVDVASYERESINEWLQTCEVQTGTYERTDYDFEKPKADLEVRSSQPAAHAHGELAVFDYHPCDYTEASQGEFYARVCREALQSEYERFRGQGNPRGLGLGHLFKLKEYPREAYNKDYLVVGVTHTLQSVEYELGTITDQPSYRLWTEFEAIDSQRPFRPPRVTPKSMVRGPQTAMVVGPPGEEIHTDKYGRVKLKFRWDHLNTKDDDSSSCWIRVSQAWAGKKWGHISIPRIGQEVIVDFLEGDPDQPIVTGRLYNGEQMPPYDLPGNKTQSGNKSRSSAGGTEANFNEIRFEDKKGSEQLYIHAEKNQDNVVENDETTDVGHDRTEKVGSDESVTVGNNRTISVDGCETKIVMLHRTHAVGINETIGIGAAQEVAVGAGRITTIGINDALSIGRNLVIDAGDSITIKTGAASITMRQDGTISIQGKDILVQGSGKITVRAKSDVVIKGSNTGIN